MTNNKDLWTELHKNSTFRPKYPHGRIIQFVFSNFSRNNSKKYSILDHWCWTGRHLKFLYDEWYNSYWVDISIEWIKYCKSLISDKIISNNIKLLTSENMMKSYFCFNRKERY